MHYFLAFYINQSINQFISHHSTEARATARLCRIKEKCLETDLKCVNGWSSSTVQWKRVPKSAIYFYTDEYRQKLLHTILCCWKYCIQEITTHTCSHNTHSENGIVSNLGIAVMWKLAEYIKHLQPRIGSRYKRKCKWNGTFDHWLSVTQLQPWQRNTHYMHSLTVWFWPTVCGQMQTCLYSTNEVNLRQEQADRK